MKWTQAQEGSLIRWMGTGAVPSSLVRELYTETERLRSEVERLAGLVTTATVEAAKSQKAAAEAQLAVHVLRGELDARPALTRADVEAALGRADNERVSDALNYVLRTAGTKPVVDLVCAVLGVS